MDWLNYHHLLYFWTVAREGSIARACETLHLTQPTISGQLRVLERAVKAKLFDRVGRNLVLTETGRVVYRYADEIFSLGRELQEKLSGELADSPMRLVVGASPTIPKTIVVRLLEPALQLEHPVRIVYEEGDPEQLLGRLAIHAVDVVLSDVPASPLVKVRAFDHLLGECGVSFMGSPELACKYRDDFPRLLTGAPFLLPGSNSILRRSLEQWLEAEGLQPVIRGEFADSAMLKVFGSDGLGLFVVPSVVENEVCEQYRVEVIGRVESIRERFYAISTERKLKHPAVIAMTQTARQSLFG